MATAVIVESSDQAVGGWDILGTRLKTQFSNNIRNNFGFLNRAAPEGVGAADKLFVQEGRKVFREVVPLVSDMIVQHASDLGVARRRRDDLDVVPATDEMPREILKMKLDSAHPRVKPVADEGDLHSGGGRGGRFGRG